MANKDISRRDFFSYSAMLGAGTIAGASLLASCGDKKDKLTPLRQPGDQFSVLHRCRSFLKVFSLLQIPFSGDPFRFRGIFFFTSAWFLL